MADTITITATRPSPSLQPDQVAVTLDATGDVTIGLDNILQALAGTGISERDLVREGTRRVPERLASRSAAVTCAARDGTLIFSGIADRRLRPRR